MNLYQLCGAIRTKIRAQTWPSVSSVVWGSTSVRVTVGPSPEAIMALPMPCALIAPMDSNSDPEHHEAPGLMVQRISVTLVTAVPSDEIGEAALMGANEESATTSPGKGLLQLEERLHNAIQLLTAQDSINIQFSHAGAAGARIDETMGYIVFRDYYFDALITTSAS